MTKIEYIFIKLNYNKRQSFQTRAKPSYVELQIMDFYPFLWLSFAYFKRKIVVRLNFYA